MKADNYPKISGIIKAIILALSIAVSLSGNAYSEGEGDGLDEIKLYVGEARVISVSHPRRVAIGNSDVADIADVSEDMLMLSPKKEGITTLTYWDNTGEHIYPIRVIKENVKDVQIRTDSILKELNLPRVQTKLVATGDKVLVVGDVKSDKDREMLDLALSPLKKKITNLVRLREEEIVEIEAQVIELTKDGTKKLGIGWPGSMDITERGSPGISEAGTKWSTLFKVLNLSRTQFSWTLDALVEEGEARILSKPRLVCLSGKEAEMLVGGEKPILTSQLLSTTGGTTTEVSYKEFGVKLKVKPTITESNKIYIKLNIEVSEVGEATVLGLSTAPTALAYPLTKRMISTEVLLNDNQTLGIGGLIKQKREEEITRTPFLSDIPIIGLLFKKKTSKVGGGLGEKGDTELFVVLTPTIVAEAKKEVKGSPSKLMVPSQVSKETSVVSSSGDIDKKAGEISKETLIVDQGAIPAQLEKPEEKPQEDAVKKETGASDILQKKEEMYNAVYEKKPELPAEVKEGKTLGIRDTGSSAPSALKEAKIESVVTPVSGAGKSVSDSLTEYTNLIRKVVLDKLTYPTKALEDGLEGRTKLKLHLSSSGKLLDTEVKETSKYEILDKNAVSTAQSIETFPPFPYNIKQSDLWIEIPIDYQLN